MPISILYGLREAIAEIIEQSLELFRERHKDNAQRLYEGLQNIGLQLYVQNPEERLTSITSVRIPHGVKIEEVQKYLNERYIERRISFSRVQILNNLIRFVADIH